MLFYALTKTRQSIMVKTPKITFHTLRVPHDVTASITMKQNIICCSIKAKSCRRPINKVTRVTSA